MNKQPLIPIITAAALLASVAVAFGQPTFVQTPPGDRASLRLSPNSWDTVTFTVTATKSDTPGITSWDLRPLLDGAVVTVVPDSAGPHDAVTWELTWTPTHDHQGSVVLLFSATDGNGTYAHPVKIDVEDKAPPAGDTDYQAMYDEMDGILGDFETYLASDDPSVEPVRPAVPLRMGQTVLGTSGVLSNHFLWWNGDQYESDPDYLGQMKDQIDQLIALGVDVIKMNTSYPLFTDGFNTWASETVTGWTYTEIGCEDIHESPGAWGDPASGATGDPEVWEPGIDVAWSKEDFLVFYKDLADYIRSKGKEVYITHNTLKWQFSNINSLGYFDLLKAEEGWDMTAIRARYRMERSSEFAYVCEALQPDYALIIAEAGEQNRDFGDLQSPGGGLEDTPLFLNRYLTPDNPAYDLAWGAYVDDAIAAFKAIPGGPPPTALGVCMAAWDLPDAADSLVRRYAGHPDIDFIDWHLFPGKIVKDPGTPDEVVVDPLRNIVTWTNAARAINPAVRIFVGECWLHKGMISEWSQEPSPPPLLYGARTHYSFWSRQDQKYLELTAEACKRKGIELLMPWWGPYFFFDYLAHDELPSDHRAPDWNPPFGYDLTDIGLDECAGLALFSFYKDEEVSTWWSAPGEGRLAQGKLTLTGEKFKTLALVEICDNGYDDDFDALADGADPDCIVEYTLAVDPTYQAGSLDLTFTLGVPEAATWVNYLVVTEPAVRAVPLWTVPLQVIDPPQVLPISFPLPVMGVVGIWTALYTEAGQVAFQLSWVDTSGM